MTTDAEHAAVLRSHYGPAVLAPTELRAAIERAIELLEWLQQYDADLAKFGPGGEWS